MSVAAVKNYTTPAALSQSALGEDFVYGFNCAPAISGVETPTVMTMTFVQILPPLLTVVTLADSPIVVGNVVTQRIRSAVLSAGFAYELRLLWQPSGTTNEFLDILTIVCPVI